MEELNNQVNAKIIEIIKLIKQTPEYQKNLKLKQVLSEDIELNNLINNIKKIQKKSISNPSKLTEQELTKLTTNLYNNVLYQEYLNTIDDLNQYLSLLKKIEDYLKELTK